ncbi:hypothetical protein [Ramlibacter sp.]|uniref:hypothetical protein n=1 Tax=Ramlibacter sp. TaxID=1917967 RepID=UPI003D14DDC8
MTIIERNGPRTAAQIKVEDHPSERGYVRILNAETHSIMSHGVTPTAAHIEEFARECFEAGRQAKAAELRAVLGVA